MKKTRSGMTIGLGVPTVLMIFVVIGMCILSLLTYLEAKQNYIATQEEISNVSDYYQADAKAKYAIHCLSEKEDISTMDGLTIHSNGFDILINDKKILHVVLENNEIIEYRVVEVE